MKLNKDLLRPGDIILVHTNGFEPVSWAIRTLTKSFFNHCALYVGDNFVVEALMGGVVKIPIEKYLDNNKYDYKVVRIKPEAFLDIKEYENGIGAAVEMIENFIGKRYDFGAIAWIGIKYILKGINKNIPFFKNNLFQGRERFFCSELICQCYYKVSSLHYYLFQGKTKQKCSSTTPKDLGKSEYVNFIDGVNKQ